MSEFHKKKEELVNTGVVGTGSSMEPEKYYQQLAINILQMQAGSTPKIDKRNIDNANAEIDYGVLRNYNDGYINMLAYESFRHDPTFDPVSDNLDGNNSVLASCLRGFHTLNLVYEDINSLHPITLSIAGKFMTILQEDVGILKEITENEKTVFDKVLKIFLIGDGTMDNPSFIKHILSYEETDSSEADFFNKFVETEIFSTLKEKSGIEILQSFTELVNRVRIKQGKAPISQYESIIDKFNLYIVGSTGNLSQPSFYKDLIKEFVSYPETEALKSVVLNNYIADNKD